MDANHFSVGDLGIEMMEKNGWKSFHSKRKTMHLPSLICL